MCGEGLKRVTSGRLNSTKINFNKQTKTLHKQKKKKKYTPKTCKIKICSEAMIKDSKYAEEWINWLIHNTKQGTLEKNEEWMIDRHKDY